MLCCHLSAESVRLQRTLKSSYAGLLQPAAGAPAADEGAGEAAGAAREGTVLSVDTVSGHVFIAPDDGSQLVCCPLWSVDDWVAMRPGTLVEYEVDRRAGPLRLEARAADGEAHAAEGVQMGLAVRVREAGEGMALEDVLEHLERMIAQDNNRRFKRLLFNAAQGEDLTQHQN